MEPKRDLAIVLKTLPFEDRHRIVTALTENHGQISGLARNSIQSRRFGGTLEPFTASEWLFVDKGSELVRIDEAHIKRAYEGLRKDFEKLSLASAFSEFMMRIAPKNEKCVDLFKLHTNALAALEELPGPGSPDFNNSNFQRTILILLNGYLAKALQWSGNQPQLQGCHGCHRSLDTLPPHASLTCLIQDAAWMCPDCRLADTQHIRDRGQQGFQAAQIRVTPLVIIDFLMALVSPIRQIPTHAQASHKEHTELFHFIEALFEFHLPGFEQKPLNSVRFLGIESNIQTRSK